MKSMILLNKINVFFFLFESSSLKARTTSFFFKFVALRNTGNIKCIVSVELHYSFGLFLKKINVSRTLALVFQ